MQSIERRSSACSEDPPYHSGQQRCLLPRKIQQVTAHSQGPPQGCSGSALGVYQGGVSGCIRGVSGVYQGCIRGDVGVYEGCMRVA
jgi:hypothetical protein